MDPEKKEFNLMMEKLEAKLKEWGVDLHAESDTEPDP